MEPLASNDQALVQYRKGDYRELFRVLNGRDMGHLLRTLEGLMAVGFVPNFNRYEGDMRAAGVFNDRLKVAMSAVLSRSAGILSLEKFATDHTHMLGTIPEDQRRVILDYYAGSTERGGAATQDVNVSLMLEHARQAVIQTEAELPQGAGNRLEDVSPKNLACNSVRAFTDKSVTSEVQRIAERARRLGCGNCDEQSAVAYMLLKAKGVRPLDWMKLSYCGDHAFVLLGLPDRCFTINQDGLKQWGSRVVVCDPWQRDWYLASLIPTRMKSYDKGQTFGAMSYAREAG